VTRVPPGPLTTRHLATGHLAGGRPGQLVDERHHGGHLEPREAHAAVRAHVVLGELGPGGADEHGLDGLAGAVVRNPDDGGVDHAVQLGQHPLHLPRVDVEPVDDDQVRRAVDEVQVTVTVEEPDVGGAEPALRVRAARPVGPVAGEQVRAAQRHQAGVLGGVGDVVEGVELVAVVLGVRFGERPAGGVDEPQLDPGQRAPHRAGLGPPPAPVGGDHGPGLGEPVPLEDPQAGGGVEIGEPVRRQGRTAGGAQPHPGRGRAQLVGREVEQRPEHRRHPGHPADAVLGEHARGVGGFEAVHEDGRGAGEADLQEARGQPEDVEQRQGQQHPVHRGDGRGPQLGGLGPVGEHGPVRQAHAARRAGGAGGVDEQGDVLTSLAGGHRAVVDVPCSDVRCTEDRGPDRRGAAGRVTVVRPGHDDGGAAVAEDDVQLAGHGDGSDRDRDRPGVQRPQHGQAEGGAIAQPDDDAVARTHSRAPEPDRLGPGGCGDVRPGQRGTRGDVDDRRMVGPRRCRPDDQLREVRGGGGGLWAGGAVHGAPRGIGIGSCGGAPPRDPAAGPESPTRRARGGRTRAPGNAPVRRPTRPVP
jgi:hypothetical protein